MSKVLLDIVYDAECHRVTDHSSSELFSLVTEDSTAESLQRDQQSAGDVQCGDCDVSDDVSSSSRAGSKKMKSVGKIACELHRKDSNKEIDERGVIDLSRAHIRGRVTVDAKNNTKSRMNVDILLDTGSDPSNYISHRVRDHLKSDRNIYLERLRELLVWVIFVMLYMWMKK